MSETFNVLFSSAGRRVHLMRLFQKSLDRLAAEGHIVPSTVVASDLSPTAPAFQDARLREWVPRCTSPDFIAANLDLCRDHDIRLVVPLIDTELMAWATHRDRFAEIGVAVMISAPEVVALAADKRRTFRWLTAAGLPTVRQAPAPEVLAEPDRWPFPLIAKPAGGSCSIGVERVGDVDALRAASRADDTIVQTIAPGEEYTVSVLVDRRGQVVCAVPRRRLEVRAGEVSKGMTVRAPELLDLARRVVAALPGPRGAMNIQVFWDRASGALNVIELNPRFGGGYPLAHMAGADYPRWLVQELLGLPSDARADAWTDRLVMLRYDDAIFIDAATLGLPALLE